MDLLMTKEQRDLLLKDISARLPYGVKVKTTLNGWNNAPYIVLGCVNDVILLDCPVYDVCDNEWSVEDVRPYLFPMSSMSEEQKREYNKWKHIIPVCRYEYGDVVEEIALYDSPESFEYLIENHFDYRGLIDKGLAIDATNLNIY